MRWGEQMEDKLKRGERKTVFRKATPSVGEFSSCGRSWII